MRIAVPKEVQDNEMRVGLTPDGALRAVEAGAQVAVQAQAGAGASFADGDYRAAGAEIVADAADVWAAADLLVRARLDLLRLHPH